MCYRVNESSTYKKDLKKNKKSIPGLENSISTVVSQLKEDNVDPKYKRHKLIGRMVGMQSVHVKPDFILVFSVDKNNNVIELHRAGTHANIMENRLWVKRG